ALPNSLPRAGAAALAEPHRSSVAPVAGSTAPRNATDRVAAAASTLRMSFPPSAGIVTGPCGPLLRRPPGESRVDAVGARAERRYAGAVVGLAGVGLPRVVRPCRSALAPARTLK